MKTLFAMTLMVMACSGGNGDDDPVSCDPADRIGTYLVEYREIDGNCGPIDSSIARTDSPDPILETSCALDAADRWSEADCKLERAYSCATDAGLVSITAVTTQRDSNGDLLSGTATFSVTDSLGLLCRSTYTVTFTRQ